MYLRGEPDYLHEDWLTKSIPVQMSKVVLGHAIHDQTNCVAYFNLLNNFNVGLTLSSTFLVSVLAILAFSYLINRLTNRIQERPPEACKSIAVILTKFRNKTLSAIGIFFLFVHLFLWLTQLFLTNNIKTNKVVVDTSQLVRRHLSTQNKTI